MTNFSDWEIFWAIVVILTLIYLIVRFSRGGRGRGDTYIDLSSDDDGDD